MRPTKRVLHAAPGFLPDAEDDPAAARPRPSRAPLALLALSAVALVSAQVLMPSGFRGRAVVTSSTGMVAGAVAAGVVLLASRRPDAWASARRYGLALVALVLAQAAFLVTAVVAPPHGPYGSTWLVDLAVVGMALLLLPLFWSELREHFPRGDRREVIADIVLLAAASGTLVYLLLRPDGPQPATTSASLVVWVGVVMTGVVAWTALAMWLPSPVHIGLSVFVACLGVSGLAFGSEWFRGHYVPGQPLVSLPLGLGALLLGALLWAEPRLVSPTPAQPRTRWGRALLTAVAVGVSCASLASVALTGLNGTTSEMETAVAISLLGAAVTARTLLNQITSTRASEQVARALGDKQGALERADGALLRLRELHRSLSASEERLRLLLDVAADGIVELDGSRVIRRANEAFCALLAVDPREAVGVPWPRLAAAVEGGASLLELPETGRATLHRRGQDLHLEARTSALPAAGELLIVRDVTAARVADQTIRSLLQFLQDRDEDRTRLLRRTNAAIESERNRIARDLHDGPVQGVSAASLSLEAVLMMLRNGHVEKAADTLEKIRGEISEENESLRRLMSDMRPPVLDERGLVPALQEILARFGRETGVERNFQSRALVDVPPDLETLAYRIVQEALTNATKHAHASEVGVSVEAVAGSLRIEIEDNGVGFDANRARDFLRAGRVGLASMRERTELANGSFMVRSAPGQGTSIVATLPLDVAAPRGGPETA
ncbi:MAG: ATP-binding protein [Actinomycetota bacterium]